MSSLWIFVPRCTKDQSIIGDIIGGTGQCSEEIHNLATQTNRIGQNHNPTSIAVNWTFSAFFQGVSLSSNLNLLDKPFTYIGLGTIPCSHLRFPPLSYHSFGGRKSPRRDSLTLCMSTIVRSDSNVSVSLKTMATTHATTHTL